MNSTEQMYGYCPPMVNSIPECNCDDEKSFHSLFVDGITGCRDKFCRASSFEFTANHFLSRCMDAVMDCLAMAGIVLLAGLLTLLFGI